MAARQWLVAAGRGQEKGRRRTKARGNKQEGAWAYLGYMEHDGVVKRGRGGRRWAGGGDRRRCGSSNDAGDLEKERAQVSDGVE